MNEATLFLRHYLTGGGSASPAIRKLIDSGEPESATVIARLALRNAEGQEREELFAILNELTSAPSGWAAASPSRSPRVTTHGPR
jgi:uncharacterized protein (DUF1786 family)